MLERSHTHHEGGEMKYLLTFGAVLAALVVAGTSAAGPAVKDPRVPALQKRIAALESQVGTLQQQVQHDELVVTCGFATQQAYNIVNLNLWATLVGASPYSGPGPDDGGACSKLGVPAPSVRSLAAHGSLAPLESALRSQLRLARTH
jgi:hypothetical protein